MADPPSQISVFQAFHKPERATRGPRTIDLSPLPLVRMNYTTSSNTMVADNEPVPLNISLKPMGDIIKRADEVLTKLSGDDKRKEMMSNNADNCFLYTEADTIHFASVFVQPPVHSYFRSYLDSDYDTRSNDKSHFTYQAEVSRAATEQTAATRSDFLYYSESAAELRKQKINQYRGNPRGAQGTNAKVRFIVEYKRALRIDYKQFQKLSTSQPGETVPNHVRAFIAQCAKYGAKENCRWVALTDMCGMIIMHFPDLVKDNFGLRCNIYFTDERDKIRRCWLGGLIKGWDDGGNPPNHPPGGPPPRPDNDIVNGIAGLSIN